MLSPAARRASKGWVAGGCAAVPVDGKVASRKPPEEYVGFRVVKDATSVKTE